MELTWQSILFIYIILAFALYGIFHWIEVVLGNIMKKIQNLQLKVKMQPILYWNNQICGVNIYYQKKSTYLYKQFNEISKNLQKTLNFIIFISNSYN